MERPTPESSVGQSHRILRRAQGGLIYHLESDHREDEEEPALVGAQEIRIPAFNEPETMDLLATSARNSSTPIRPYYHHYTSERS